MMQFCLSAWRCGFRSRGVQVVLVIGILLIGVAFLSASFSPRQPKTVALDVGFSGLRFSLVLFALFWVQELVANEIERRTVAFSLTFPVRRANYVLGRYAGVAGLLALAALLLGLLLWLAVLMVESGYEQRGVVLLGLPYWISIFGFWVDALVVAAFALLLSSLSTVNLMPMAVGLAFAIAGKSLGSVIDYLSRGADGDAKLVSAYSPVINYIQYALPDLSRFDWRIWPMYGQGLPDHAIPCSLLMALGYGSFMLSLAVIAFNRREFT